MSLNDVVVELSRLTCKRSIELAIESIEEIGFKVNHNLSNMNPSDDHVKLFISW